MPGLIRPFAGSPGWALRCVPTSSSEHQPRDSRPDRFPSHFLHNFRETKRYSSMMVNTRRHAVLKYRRICLHMLAFGLVAALYMISLPYQTAIFPMSVETLEANNVKYQELFERKFPKNEDRKLALENVIWPRNWKRLMDCEVSPPDGYGTETEKLYSSEALAKFLPSCDGYIFLPSTSCAEHVNRFVRDVLPLMKRPFVLITADGDASFPGSVHRAEIANLLNHPLLLRWYTQNYDGAIHHPKLYALPIGFDLHTPRDGLAWDTPEMFAKFYAERREALSVTPSMRHHEPLLPAWTTENRHRDRHLLPMLLDTCGIPYSHQESMGTMEELSRNYLSTHSAGFSPHGRGLDCHRTFEMLWFGMIPIVKSSPLDVLYKNRLPVVVLDDWQDLCSNGLLEQLLQEAEAMALRDEVFTMPYWLAPS